MAACSGGATEGDDPSSGDLQPSAASESSAGGGDGGATSAGSTPYVVDPDALVEKAGIYTTYRRTVGGTTVMKPRNTHICVLSDVQGSFDADNDIVGFGPTIAPTGNDWALLGGGGINVGSICYGHANFSAPAGSIIMWQEDPGYASIDSGWPSCTGSSTMGSWFGDAITFINSVYGEFQGGGESVSVVQTGMYGSGRSKGIAHTQQCNSTVIGMFGTYFVGIPQNTAPVFVGGGDARLTAVQAGSEFGVSAKNGTDTIAMARTDKAMCYLTRFSGNFNGGGERLRIFPQVVNGVERWHLQATAGSGASAYGNARCFAFSQAQIMVPGPD